MNHRLLIKTSLLVIALVFATIFSSKPVGAQQNCDYAGQCLNGQRCVDVGGGILVPGGGTCGGASVIGGVSPPKGVSELDLSVGGSGSIGIIVFISRIIRLLTIVAGVWVMINFIIAGYHYISGFGDTGATTKVRDRITWSIVGLVVMVGAYTIAGLVGLIFFGDATFILEPQLQGALTP